MKPFKSLTLLFVFTFLSIFSVFSQDLKPNYQNIVTDSTFVNLKGYSDTFVFDMKYATTDNFLRSKVYDCAECYLRLKTVKALIKANESFQALGYKIKIFDCYRPLSIQKQMWEIVPNPSYVANPAKGSIHNRGGAVDITLIDSQGNEIDFGTPFDFFGKEASHSYKKLDTKIKRNRKMLRKIMEENGFNALESEWWHYNFSGAMEDPVSNFKWNCD